MSKGVGFVQLLPFSVGFSTFCMSSGGPTNQIIGLLIFVIRCRGRHGLEKLNRKTVKSAVLCRMLCCAFFCFALKISENGASGVLGTP